MAVSLPNGATLTLATTYGSVLTVTAVTNASPPVATSTAHGLANGDFIEVTSGWSRLNDRLCRVSGVTANTFNFEGVDATSTTLFPIGSGTGSVRKVTAFTQITQLLEMTSTGGEMQFVTYSFLEQDFETQLPTQSSPQQINITVGDDATLAGYIALKDAALTRTARGLKATLPSGSIISYNGIVNFDETPSMTKNQVMGCKGGFALRNRPLRYAS